MLEYLKQEI